MSDFILHPFPGPEFTGAGGVAIQGSIVRASGTLVLSFVLRGNLDDLVLPAPAQRTREDNLWQSTCLEMFWGEEGEKNYWELNLAPTGAWNVYAFADYRTGMQREERIGEPLFEITRTPETFSLTAELGITDLPAGHPPLRVGVSGVLRHRDSRLSYWALAHPADKPDFHAPQGFLLRL